MPPTQPVSILLEVLAYIPTDYFHCLHCEQIFGVAGIGTTVRQEVRSTFPPEVLKDAERLVVWLGDLAAQYGSHLHIHVVDPQSMEGFVKSLRYWVRRYPTFIINRRTKYTGWEPTVVERLLADRIASGETV